MQSVTGGKPFHSLLYIATSFLILLPRFGLGERLPVEVGFIPADQEMNYYRFVFLRLH